METLRAAFAPHTRTHARSVRTDRPDDATPDPRFCMSIGVEAEPAGRALREGARRIPPGLAVAVCGGGVFGW